MFEIGGRGGIAVSVKVSSSPGSNGVVYSTLGRCVVMGLSKALGFSCNNGNVCFSEYTSINAKHTTA